jgi:alpha-tubulin suppressor-like RCC1 family protein
MARVLRLTAVTLVLLTASSCGSGGDQASPSPQVASVTVTPTELSLLVGQSQQLTATLQDPAGNPLESRPIAWAPTDANVATVSPTGMVLAVAAGSTAIVATAEGKSGQATVSVASPPAPPGPASVASVTVEPGEVTLLVGVSQELKATARDDAGNPLPGRAITWSTSVSAVATVSENGVVMGVAQGTATITATSEGKNGNASIVVVPSVTYSSVAAGGAHTCALSEAGAAFCWGRGESGQLGIPVPTTTCMTDGGPFPCSMVPVAVSGGLTFAELAAGGAHTCGLVSDGTAYCWGNNGAGQLGDNTYTHRSSPVPVVTELKFVSLDAGAQHTCGLTSDGTAYCWALNGRGELGDGTTTTSTIPVAVIGGHRFQTIAAGGFAQLGAPSDGHTCALTDGGDAYCWGDASRGHLGTGSGGLNAPDLDPHPVPEPVVGGLVFTGLRAGLGSHTCGLVEAGDAYCWGANDFGALGNGSTEDSPVPVQVNGGVAFARVVAGGFIGHTCGLTSIGQAYCWGENERGQVGDGSTKDRLEPMAVTGGLTFSALDAGFRHSCGLATTGALYCWGSGGAG